MSCLLQHPTGEHMDEVFDFMQDCDVAEFGEEDSSRDDLAQQWSEIDLSRDAWITYDQGGGLNGYACVSGAAEGLQQDIYILLTTTPAGIEDVLMKACLERARELRAKAEPGREFILKGYATAVNIRLQQVYEKFGFSRHTVHYRMQINLSAPLPAPEWPPRYRLAPYDLRDEQELYDLIESAFDWQGRERNSIENWRNLVLRGGRFDPRYFLLVRDGERLIAAALAYNEGIEGWIRQLAVAKDHQGFGLGGLLLRQMFHLFSVEGLPRVALGVASVNEKACKFYERNGMFRSREFIEYRKPID